MRKIFFAISKKYGSKKASDVFFQKHLEELGLVYSSNTKKYAIREEKTPSAAVMKGLFFYDFGTSEKVSLVEFLETRVNPKTGKNFTEEEAINFIVELDSGMNTQEIERLASIPEVIKPKKPPFKESYIKRLAEERDKNKEKFWKLMKGLCRSCSKEEAVKAVNLFQIGYSLDEWTNEEGEFISEERLFIPERDFNGVPYNCYKYNRGIESQKGRFRKNGKRTLFGSHLIKTFNPKKPIFAAEGHSDAIVNNAKGMQSVSTGSASTPIGDSIVYLKGKTLHIYPDLDKPGIIGACKKVLEIEEFNSQVEENEKIKFSVYLWGNKFFETDKKTGEKVFRDQSYIDEIINIFIEEKKKSYDKKPGDDLRLNLLKKQVKDWKVVIQTQVLKAGFDAIDFHENFSGHKNYGAFIKKYHT